MMGLALQGAWRQTPRRAALEKVDKSWKHSAALVDSDHHKFSVER
jgi:hypothetical protein